MFRLQCFFNIQSIDFILHSIVSGNKNSRIFSILHFKDSLPFIYWHFFPEHIIIQSLHSLCFSIIYFKIYKPNSVLKLDLLFSQENLEMSIWMVCCRGSSGCLQNLLSILNNWLLVLYKYCFGYISG